jgi:hypothetical protein
MLGQGDVLHFSAAFRTIVYHFLMPFFGFVDIRCWKILVFASNSKVLA